MHRLSGNLKGPRRPANLRLLTNTLSNYARHILCATGNNIDALVNLVVFDAPVTYLSFPISAPRELQNSGDSRFTEIINKAHLISAQEMSATRTRSFISPLSIDELPIVFKAQELPQEAQEVEFDCNNGRWNLMDLWGDPDLIIAPRLGGLMKFPVAQVQGASGTIQTDVGWRDRRLVLQSESLSIICPKPPHEDRITRGVSEEIQTAVALGIVCNIWEKPEWDPDDFVGKTFPPAGSMGIGQTQAVVRKIDTLEGVIRAKP